MVLHRVCTERQNVRPYCITRAWQTASWCELWQNSQHKLTTSWWLGAEKRERRKERGEQRREFGHNPAICLGKEV